MPKTANNTQKITSFSYMEKQQAEQTETKAKKTSPDYHVIAKKFSVGKTSNTNRYQSMMKIQIGLSSIVE